MDHAVKILELLLSWPVAVIVLGLLFRWELRRTIGRVQHVKAGSVEVSLLPLLGALAAQRAESQLSSGANADIASIINKEMQAIAGVIEAAEEPTTGISCALWVDDRPAKIVAERSVLERFGIKTTIAMSTIEAQGLLEHREFDLVISDISRPESSSAGFDLLEWMSGNGIMTPSIIYCGYVDEHRAQRARDLDAYGITSSPNEVVRLAIAAVRERKSRRAA